jgi:hypothetical protein
MCPVLPTVSTPSSVNMQRLVVFLYIGVLRRFSRKKLKDNLKYRRLKTRINTVKINSSSVEDIAALLQILTLTLLTWKIG